MNTVIKAHKVQVNDLGKIFLMIDSKNYCHFTSFNRLAQCYHYCYEIEGCVAFEVDHDRWCQISNKLCDRLGPETQRKRDFESFYYEKSSCYTGENEESCDYGQKTTEIRGKKHDYDAMSGEYSSVHFIEIFLISYYMIHIH